MAKKKALDVLKFLVNEKFPDGPDPKWMWYAGEQLVALRFYLGSDVSIEVMHKDSGVGGRCYAILRFPEGVRALWSVDFGCCTATDGLEMRNGFEYIAESLSGLVFFNVLDDLMEDIPEDVLAEFKAKYAVPNVEVEAESPSSGVKTRDVVVGDVARGEDRV